MPENETWEDEKAEAIVRAAVIKAAADYICDAQPFDDNPVGGRRLFNRARRVLLAAFKDFLEANSE